MLDSRILKHLASLARIDLEGRDKDKLFADTKKILEYVESLKQADTSGVEPLSGGSFLRGVLRKDGDGVCETGERKRALGQFPKSRDEFLSVPSVFE